MAKVSSFKHEKMLTSQRPAKGKVVFKGPFRNQGVILMLDHGEKVFTVLMGMDKDKIDAQVGQKVYAGQKLGIMPGYGDIKACALP
jgi:septal ring factor EnvC (AmiA/AmiB activator)